MLRRLLNSVIETTLQPIESTFYPAPFTRKETATFSWLMNYAPCFPVNAKNITILTEPKQFYEAILNNCRTAEKRITLVSLYLGNGVLETKLVESLRSNKRFKDRSLTVNVLLDFTRGSRSKDNSRRMLQPLLKDNKNCNVSLYHTPVLRGLFKKFTPDRWNELYGLQHMKLYIFDDTLIISGANLSKDYFTNRQDRYFMIKDKALCDFYQGLVQNVQSFSLKMRADDTVTLNDNWSYSPYKGSKQKFVTKSGDLIEGYLMDSRDNQNSHKQEGYGATREIGTALTRICLRHKAVESRMKTFTSTIMECLILPLQDKLEEWKKTVLNLDKEHAKDYKRARAELKKRSTDTLRLQKKMRKGAGGDLQKRLECGLQDVTERRQLLEETEKHAVRAALIEERGRFCTFVGLLKPVVDEEVAMLTEMGHLQEAVQQLEKHAAEPNVLPPASEQVIADLKSSDSGWSFQTPPSSPSSLGSRKSSMCSISSLNSSSSGSSKSHHSPSHPHWQRSLSQPVGRSGTIRYMSVSSQDSGFTSQDTLYPRPPSSFSIAEVSNMSEHSTNSSSSSTPCTPFPATAIPTSTSTWPNLQETIQFERAASAIISDRPHTISSAYEKGHQRPPLTVYTFQAPDQSLSQPASPVTSITPTESNPKPIPPRSPASSVKSFQIKPPLPTRCSSLERPNGPNIPAKTIAGMQGVRVLPPTTADQTALRKPSPLPAHLSKRDTPQPTYVNMHELASMAANKAQEKTSFPPPPAEFTSSPSNDKVCSPKTPTNPDPKLSIPHTPNEGEKDGSTSESSLESSSGYGSQTTFTPEDVVHADGTSYRNHVNDTASKYCTLPRNSDLLNAARRRPLSMTAMCGGTMRNTLLRRGSMQNNKPPPPIRRTSSITNTNTAGQITSMGSMENLPPPPAFLLEPNQNSQQAKSGIGVNVAETVKALTELRHTPASPNSIRRMSASSQSLFQTQTNTTPSPNNQNPLFSTFQSQPNQKVSYVSQSGGVVYAQPSQIMGGSPNAVRRINNFRSQSADRKAEGPGGVSSGFIATLSAKLVPNMSPRSSRRHSEDMVPVNIAPQTLNKRGPGQSFLDSLNAKLNQQHISNSSPPAQPKANKIRQIINSKAQPDPKVCHESLMDQIKRGATLKRAKIINDRSAPKIY